MTSSLPVISFSLFQFSQVVKNLRRHVSLSVPKLKGPSYNDATIIYSMIDLVFVTFDYICSFQFA